MDLTEIFDFIIIGAGISGLHTARELQKNGFSVRVLEKSKSVGGRMATRRIGSYKFDHGAQFLDIDHPELSALDIELTKSSILAPWFIKNDKWMKAAKNGMTQVPKFIAQGLDIIFSEKVTQIQKDKNEIFCVWCESQNIYRAKKIILSSPLPQSLKILNESGLSYPTDLNQINYASAIVGLFALETLTEGLMNLIHTVHLADDIQSISNQQSKNVSPSPAFTMVMNSEWSARCFEMSDDELSEILKLKFIKNMGLPEDLSFVEIQVKKWKFSQPVQTFKKPFFSLSYENNIFLVGDAFGGASVKGALRSAQAMVQHFCKG